ncbi:5-aminolevulic acid synthase [Pseudoruegeria sp. HB172150]|uniref:5-aminolevulic acid synthase n=1 Tax=Pseudoruegeria sp. HB172150 TaxID=2721164 RepID=UPI001552DAB2|nr:5-aminolevulic acid synthase [Pseudoruegeria sp. HB172150]
MRRVAMVFLPSLCMATHAFAQPLTGAEAKDLLFNADELVVAVNPAAELSDKDRNTLDILVESNGFGYYGAISFAPEEGLLSESLQGAFNFHSVEDANAAARAACEASRKPDGSPCIIAAQLLPQRWRPARFQLSQDATRAFEGYLEEAGEKALASSSTTGAFAVGTGEDAESTALEECNARAPDKDCVIALRN